MSGTLGSLAGCLLLGDDTEDENSTENDTERNATANDTVPRNTTANGNQTAANSTDSDSEQEEIIPPTVAESSVTDNYAYLTVNDPEYYQYLRTGFASRQTFTTEFTPQYGALRVDIPEGSHYGMSMWFLPEEQWGDRCDDLHVRYWIYVPEDLTIDDQLKLPAVGNRKTQGWGGRSSDGTGGWSSHIALNEQRRSDPGLEFYTYHADMSGDFGDLDEWGVEIPTGAWSKLDFYVNVNTPGEHDGAIRGWLNDEFGHERTGLLFREEGYEELNIDEIWLTIYHGGQAPSPADNFLILGDQELWKDRGEQLE